MAFSFILRSLILCFCYAFATFPETFGPFTLIESQLVQDDFDFEFSKENLDPMQREGQPYTMKNQECKDFKGVMMPPARESLPKEVRNFLGIPAIAKFRSFALPMECTDDECPKEITDSKDTKRAFCLHGGYIYLDDKLGFLTAKAMWRDSSGIMIFQSPGKWQSEWTQKLVDLNRCGPYKRWGIEHVCGLRPMDPPIRPPHGALVFSGFDKTLHPNQQDIYFALLSAADMDHAHLDDNDGIIASIVGTVFVLVGAVCCFQIRRYEFQIRAKAREVKLANEQSQKQQASDGRFQKQPSVRAGRVSGTAVTFAVDDNKATPLVPRKGSEPEGTPPFFAERQDW